MSLCFGIVLVNSVASCFLPMGDKKTFFPPLPFPGSCLTSLLERSNSSGLLLAFGDPPSRAVSYYLKLCQNALLQSFKVLPSGLVITPITLTFSLQLSSILCSQVSPVSCSTLNLFCRKHYLRVQVDWLHYRASFLDL